MACMGGGFFEFCSAATLAGERGWMEEMLAGAGRAQGFSFNGDEASKVNGWEGVSSEVMTNEGASEWEDFRRRSEGG